MKTHFICTVILLLASVLPVQAQSPAPATPQWQIDAGGKMSFDVASVKVNKSGPPPTGDRVTANFAVGSGDSYSPTGGLFSVTNTSLRTLISFAYKIAPNDYQFVQSQLPKWANTERFDVQARAADSEATKDQMRVMVQSLLASRFKFVTHTETRQLPIYALVLEKPGKTGPQLRVHPAESPACSPFASGPSAKLADSYPAACGVFLTELVSGRAHTSLRNVTMSVIAGSLPLPGMGAFDRPVVDRTGLNGTFDFTLDWTPEPDDPLPSGENSGSDQDRPTFLEALKEQLGLKLESTKGPVNVLVIDHIEEPTPN